MQILCNYVFNWSKQIKLRKLYVSPNLPFFGRLCCCCLWDWHHRVIDVLYPQSETQSAQKKFRCSTDLSTYDYQVKKQTNKQKYGRWNFLKLKYIFEHIGLYGLMLERTWSLLFHTKMRLVIHNYWDLSKFEPEIIGLFK